MMVATSYSGPYGLIIPELEALTTVSIHVATPSFSRALSIWKSAVRLESPRIVTISPGVLPRVDHVNTPVLRLLSYMGGCAACVRGRLASRVCTVLARASESTGLIT